MIQDELQAIDERITLVLNGLHFEAGDHFWQFFSTMEVWIPMYAAVIFMMIWRMGWKKGLMMVLAIALTIVACDQAANLVKNTVCRLRPCYNTAMVDSGLNILENKGGYYGFFSGHAANAFGFAAASGICFETDKNHRYGVYQWMIFLWAALVSLSRIFVGKHYFGDVVAGAIVGLAFGCAIAMVFRKIVTKPGWSSPS